jgi:hypothetical protein
MEAGDNPRTQFGRRHKIIAEFEERFTHRAGAYAPALSSWTERTVNILNRASHPARRMYSFQETRVEQNALVETQWGNDMKRFAVVLFLLSTSAAAGRSQLVTSSLQASLDTGSLAGTTQTDVVG